MPDTDDAGDVEVAEFMTAWAAAAAAAAWAAAGVVALGRGLAEAAGISITVDRSEILLEVDLIYFTLTLMTIATI